MKGFSRELRKRTFHQLYQMANKNGSPYHDGCTGVLDLLPSDKSLCGLDVDDFHGGEKELIRFEMLGD